MVILGLFLMVRNRVRISVMVTVRVTNRDTFGYSWVTVTLT